MFYSETILNKKGPLAKVWLAAHWERKLSKSQFLATNIPNSISAIEDYDHMALRLSGQLLLGVCKIFSRKAKYLFEDCNEALVKIKMAFRPSVVDLNVVQSVVSNNQITLADTINEFDIMYNPVLDLNTLKTVEDNTFLSFTQDSMEVGRDADVSREFVPQNSFQKSLLDPEISMEVPRDEIQMDFGDQGALDFGFDLEKEPEAENMEVEQQMPQIDINMDFGLDLDKDIPMDVTVQPEPLEFEPESKLLSDLDLDLDVSMEKRKTPKRKRIAIDSAIFMDESYYRAMVKGDFSVPKNNEDDNPLLKLIVNYPTLSTYKYQFELENLLDLSLDDMLELQYSKFPKLDLNFLEPKKLPITYQPENTMPSIHVEEPIFEAEQAFEPEISFDAGMDMNFGDISVIQPEEPSPTKHIPEEDSLLDVMPPQNVSIFEFDEEESVDESEKLTSNTQKALNIIKDKFNGEATFSQITENESKSIAAKVFFELLVLKTKDLVSVKQAEPYGEISISAL
ncbi:sister chromatid cohesion protein 1 [Boothiomyces sp. JEL0838]|nr:sister chromatid cohesion protein 1 [Boothiomyces sp. JEL0838]